MSTRNAPIDLFGGITQTLDAKQYAIGVFIDYSTQTITNCYVRKVNFLVSVVWHSSGLIVILRTESSLCRLTSVILICLIFHVVFVPQGSILVPKLNIIYKSMNQSFV